MNFKVVLYPLNILNSSTYVKNIHVIEIREDYFNYNINYVYKIEKKTISSKNIYSNNRFDSFI